MATESSDREGLQKVNVKIPLEAPGDFNYAVVLDIFGRWRLEEGEEIIDLADYLHVPDGPGCLLVSQRWHFGIDLGDGRPGLFFSSRKGLQGAMDARFRQVIRSCLEKGKRLLAESEIPGSVRPRLDEIDIVVNDRVLAPNTQEVDDILTPAISAALDRLYGEGGYDLRREEDPALRAGYFVRAKTADGLTFDGLLERL